MWKVRATIKSYKGSSENFEIYDYLFTYFIAGCIGGSNPIIGHGAIWKNTRIESGRFSRIAIEPEAGNQFHAKRLADSIRHMSSRYVFFVIDSPDNRANSEEMRAINTFNEHLQANQQWVMAAGIAGSELASIIDNRANHINVRSGSLMSGPENYSGLWIVECGSDEEALELAKEASRACNRRVELRPFLR